MSTPQESLPVGLAEPKRAKPQRACDLCRKKKIRCNGTEMPNNRCSKCISYGVDCTYDIVSKRPPSKNYVEVLESRLQKMEELVDKLRTQVDSPSQQYGHSLSDGLPHTPSDEPSSKPSLSCASSIAPSKFEPSAPPELEDLDPSEDEMETSRRLIHKFRKFSLRGPTPVRYHGKSSNMMLLQAAIDMKSEYIGMSQSDAFTPPTDRAKSDDRWWNFTSIEDELPPHTDFPPADVMEILIDSYFNHLNMYIPLLHRPTLDRHIRDGLHLRDEGFGAVLLLVCANGCRWIKDTNDPRLEPYIKPQPGRVWFDEVERARKSIFAPPQLFDLQRITLMVEYLAGFSSPYTCWTLVGLGIRAAQDIGAHRLKTYSSWSREEGELYKRAFCSLVFFDRSISFAMGRPYAIQDEDFDVEAVEECDDEYWFTDHPETHFKQPLGKPSKIAFLNNMNRLLRILGFAYRTIYSINKHKAQFGFVGEDWEQQIVAELDSALNKWVDTVPDHLRWDPHREDLTFLNQSAVLYCNYYLVQIFVHRPFLPSTRKSSSRLSLPSLAICTNAARSCVHVSEVQYKRTGQPTMLNRVALLTSGMVLLLNMWGGKRLGLSNQSAAADVQKCMAMIRELEADPRIPGRHWDVLNTLYSAGEFEAPALQSSRKRARDSDEPGGASSLYANADVPDQYSPSTSVPLQPEDTSTADSAMKQQSIGPELISVAHPPSSEAPGKWATPSNASSPAPFDLPIHTEDLGRVPFHHGFSPYFDGAFGAFAAPAAPHSAADTPANDNLYAPAGPPGGPDSDTFQLLQSQPFLASETSAETGQNRALNGGLPTLTIDDLMLADNTLNLWSSAPTTLDWSDWGTFINNMSDGASEWPPSGVNSFGL